MSGLISVQDAPPLTLRSSYVPRRGWGRIRTPAIHGADDDGVDSGWSTDTPANPPCAPELWLRRRDERGRER